jgi:hypothetical protein
MLLTCLSILTLYKEAIVQLFLNRNVRQELVYQTPSAVTHTQCNAMQVLVAASLIYKLQT